MYNQLLKARKEALRELELDLTDEAYEIAIRAVDKFFDYIEEDVPEIAIEQTKVHELLIADISGCGTDK
jgi:hypothetical protein